MKTIYQLTTILISALILTVCKESEETHFDPVVIPGIYQGQIQYHSYDSHPTNRLDTIPGESFISELCNFTISEKENQIYNLSIDKTPIIPIPNLDFEIVNTNVDWAVGMIYLDNDPDYSLYSFSFGGTTTTSGYVPPPNNISYYENQNYILFHLYVKKNFPDSVYFLSFHGERLY